MKNRAFSITVFFDVVMVRDYTVTNNPFLSSFSFFKMFLSFGRKVLIDV